MESLSCQFKTSTSLMATNSPINTYKRCEGVDRWRGAGEKLAFSPVIPHGRGLKHTIIINTICLEIRICWWSTSPNIFRQVLSDKSKNMAFTYRTMIARTQYMPSMSHLNEDVTIVADFSPEIDPLFCWSSKHQAKSITWSLLSFQTVPVEMQGHSSPLKSVLKK